jgi:hypothetical protein
LDNIAELANQVATLGPGNRIRTKVEIPAGVTGVSYEGGNIRMIVGEDDERVELDRRTLAGVTGFTFQDEEGILKPGLYDIIVESFGANVCVYLPEMQGEYCYCLFSVDEIGSPVFYNLDDHETEDLAEPYFGCVTDAEMKCEDITIEYGESIQEFTSRCGYLQESNYVNYERPDVARVIYNITNWQEQGVFTGTVFERDSGGHYNLSKEYVVENSDTLRLESTCVHECYYVTGREALKTTQTAEIFIPHGEIVPFILDQNNEKVYIDQSNYYLIDPTGPNANFRQGWVQSGDSFILRTGYDCIDGECINVEASLYHVGKAPSGG